MKLQNRAVEEEIPCNDHHFHIQVDFVGVALKAKTLDSTITSPQEMMNGVMMIGVTSGKMKKKKKIGTTVTTVGRTGGATWFNDFPLYALHVIQKGTSVNRVPH